MTQPALLTPTVLSLQPVSTSATQTTSHTKTPPLANVFADFLNAGSAPADDAAALPDIAPTSPPTIAPTPAEEQAADTDNEDLPWPPEGLASLWSPATEPTPQFYNTALPVPSPATSNLTVTLTIHAPDTATTAPAQPAPKSPQTATPDALFSPEHPGQPASTPTDPASPEPSPALSAAPISEDLKPLSSFLEKSQGEPASSPLLIERPSNTPQATPTITAPFPQHQPLPPTTPAPFPAPDLHADNFPDAVGSHIQWLAEHKISHAHLQLNPQEMGPVEVRLKLEGDQLQAHFTSAEPDVRQALEHGLPRLRELLGEHGLHLSEGHVGQQQAQHHPASSPQGEALLEGEIINEPSPLPPPTAVVHTTRLLDAYV